MVGYVKGIETPVAGFRELKPARTMTMPPRQSAPAMVMPLESRDPPRAGPLPDDGKFPTTIINPSGLECDFLLHRLRDLTGTAEVIMQHQRDLGVLRCWEESYIITRMLIITDQLLRRLPVYLYKAVDRAILIEAIEGNRFFADMADDDPRLNVSAVRLATTLRRQVVGLLREPIGYVKLGEGRLRLPERRASR